MDKKKSKEMNENNTEIYPQFAYPLNVPENMIF